jgi:hypothetical protein
MHNNTATVPIWIYRCVRSRTSSSNSSKAMALPSETHK